MGGEERSRSRTDGQRFDSRQRPPSLPPPRKLVCGAQTNLSLIRKTSNAPTPQVFFPLSPSNGGRVSFCFNKETNASFPSEEVSFQSLCQQGKHMFLSPPRRFLFSFFLFYLFLPRLKHPRPCRPLYASDRASTAIGWKGLPLGEKGLTRWGKSGLTSQVSPSGPEPSRFSLHQMSRGGWPGVHKS